MVIFFPRSTSTPTSAIHSFPPLYAVLLRKRLINYNSTFYHVFVQCIPDQNLTPLETGYNQALTTKTKTKTNTNTKTSTKTRTSTEKHNVGQSPCRRKRRRCV